MLARKLQNPGVDKDIAERFASLEMKAFTLVEFYCF